MQPPNIVIVGRPNVGKSLLFNRLLRRRQALVHGQPGMTLDFLREAWQLPNGRAAWLVDTGGVRGESDDWTPLAEAQMQRAAKAADLLLLVADYKAGVLAGDAELAAQLRRQDAPWWVLVNKAEFASAAAAEFYSLGAEVTLPLSAKHGSGMDELRQRLAQRFPLEGEGAAAEDSDAAVLPTVAIVGRPNVGKSTFINRLLGDGRLAVSERPGTTRDMVSCRLAHAGGDVLLLDTAGMARRRAAAERDKLSVAAARRALAAADCAVLMIDLSAGTTYQDKRIAALVAAAGCALTVVANKADLVPAGERQRRLKEVVAALPPLLSPAAFAVSATAKRQLPLQRFLAALRQAAAAAHMHFPTAQLNTALAGIVAARAPRQRGKIRPKLRYAHQGGSRPPCIVIHGSAVGRIDDSYRRYLAAAFARRFSLVGNAIKIVFRSDENPYQPR